MEYNADSSGNGGRITLVYPDVYELGACNFGLRAVRHILLRDTDLAVRRAFHPAPDMYALLRESNTPWIDMEAGEPVVLSDVVGFGISSEILYTNVLSLIDLMGLELRSSKRDGSDPIILAGGGGLANPVPVMPFVDAIFLGEAEAGLAKAASILCSSLPKREKLEQVSEIPGVLVPSLHRGERVKWVRAETLKKEDAPVKQVVPLAQITHDRAVVELSRGCSRGCRFCQASQLSRPVRERTPEDALSLIRESVKSTGWEKAGLLTLSYSDYSGLEELITGLEPLEEKLHLKVSQPSLRPDTLPGLERKSFFKGSLTMAPEAGSERLRRIINKPLSDREIIKAAEAASRMGARGIKLYFMVGLPGENDGDLLAMASLADRISSIMGRKRKVTAALSPFVPKPHTPFQWTPQPDHSEMWRRINLVRNACSKASVSWNDPRVSAVEYLLACGGVETSSIVEKAFRQGAVFDGWSDLFRWDIWSELLEETSISCPGPGDSLPWDFVDTGVDRKWLTEEFERSLRGDVLDDCRISGCSGCGACAGEVPSIPAWLPASGPGNKDRREPLSVKKIRIKYAKKGIAVFSSHLDMVRMWTRALRRTGLPVHYTSGFARRVKLAFSHPIPLGMGSESEYVDFQLDEEIELREIVCSLRKALPEGFPIRAAGEISGKYRSPDAMAVAAEYIIKGVEDPGLLQDRLDCNETVFSHRVCDGGDLIIVSDPGRGASRPDRIMEAAGIRWKSITRTEIYADGGGGRFVPLLRSAEGEL